MVRELEDAPRDSVAVLLDVERSSIAGPPGDSSLDDAVRAAAGPRSRACRALAWRRSRDRDPGPRDPSGADARRRVGARARRAGRCRGGGRDAARVARRAARRARDGRGAGGRDGSPGARRGRARGTRRRRADAGARRGGRSDVRRAPPRPGRRPRFCASRSQALPSPSSATECRSRTASPGSRSVPLAERPGSPFARGRCARRGDDPARLVVPGTARSRGAPSSPWRSWRSFPRSRSATAPGSRSAQGPCSRRSRSRSRPGPTVRWSTGGPRFTTRLPCRRRSTRSPSRRSTDWSRAPASRWRWRRSSVSSPAGRRSSWPRSPSASGSRRRSSRTRYGFRLGMLALGSVLWAFVVLRSGRLGRAVPGVALAAVVVAGGVRRCVRRRRPGGDARRLAWLGSVRAWRRRGATFASCGTRTTPASRFPRGRRSCSGSARRSEPSTGARRRSTRSLPIAGSRTSTRWTPAPPAAGCRPIRSSPNETAGRAAGSTSR